MDNWMPPGSHHFVCVLGNCEAWGNHKHGGCRKFKNLWMEGILMNEMSDWCLWSVFKTRLYLLDDSKKRESGNSVESFCVQGTGFHNLERDHFKAELKLSSRRINHESFLRRKRNCISHRYWETVIASSGTYGFLWKLQRIRHHRLLFNAVYTIARETYGSG
jgi:hypothetical protein